MISVVIPTCRRPDLLSRCLEHLAPGIQVLPVDQYEVIVTDDGEPTVERLVAENYSWAKWGLGPRRGPAANRNAGAKRACGDWLAFTDDDCIPDPAWLTGFASAAHSGCDVYEGKTTCLAAVSSPLDHAPANVTGGFLWSCNSFIRRVTFEGIGGYDEEFPYPHMEDVDLRERLVGAGHHFEFVPSAVVDHPPRRTPSGLQLVRYHESWIYHWYKRGYRGPASAWLLYLTARARLNAISRHRIGGDTLRAIGSFSIEMAGVIPRLPLWEWKYCRRFRSPRSR